VNSPRVVESLARGVERYKQHYPEQGKAELGKGRPSFLHLRDATPVLNTDAIRGGGTLFRLQLSRISGFSLSSISYTRS
jgi:hypothetical protein